ncbi:hypothetical protein Tco_1034390 [Tanacetum coccineum]
MAEQYDVRPQSQNDRALRGEEWRPKAVLIPSSKDFFVEDMQCATNRTTRDVGRGVGVELVDVGVDGLDEDDEFCRKEIVDPNDDTKKILKPINKLSQQNQNQYYADIKVMNYILQGIPNDIYNFMDACKDVKTMWNRFKRLMQGTNINKQERNSRHMNEFDKLVVEDGESLTSVYERFSTLINVIDLNKVTPREISINTKFLNSLQPEWSKYVSQKYIIKEQHFDVLYDYMSQFEPHIKVSKAKKVARNHVTLALVANLQASLSYSHSPQPYYVTHPSSVIDNDDDYQGDIQGDAQVDKLSTIMMLLARAITQCYSTPTNNHLRTSSNTMNQAVIQDGRVDIQSKNIGYAGNGNRNAGRTNRNQATNARNGLVQSINEYEQNIQRVPRTESTPRKINVQ